MNERDRVAWLWGQVALMVLILLGLVLIWWAVSYYFGDEGVRVSMLGVAVLIVFVVVFGSFTVAVKMVTAVHNNTINGIVDFQAADDRGEVARMNAWRESMRGDRDVARIAAKFAQDQAKAIAAAEEERRKWQSQPPALPPPAYADDWSVVPTVSMSDYDIAD